MRAVYSLTFFFFKVGSCYVSSVASTPSTDATLEASVTLLFQHLLIAGTTGTRHLAILDILAEFKTSKK